MLLVIVPWMRLATTTATSTLLLLLALLLASILVLVRLLALILAPMPGLMLVSVNCVYLGLILLISTGLLCYQV